VAVTLGDSEVQTVAETTVTTEYTIPNLNEDVFPEDTLEILHTDFRPSEELESEIMELINNYGTTCSLYMVNLEDYATFGYNSDTYISTASTIKCPFAFYCYQEIAKGNYSFDDTLQKWLLFQRYGRT
jgi:beta-lactamase class A